MARHLAQVEYFAYVDENEPTTIHLVTVQKHRKTPSLMIHTVAVDETIDSPTHILKILSDVCTQQEMPLDFLNWNIKVQRSKHYVKTEFQLASFLRRIDSIIGVWGQMQFDYFNQSAYGVVDVQPFVSIEMSRCRSNDEDKEKCSFESISDLFLEILRKNARLDFENLKTSTAEKRFDHWIGETAWKSLFLQHESYFTQCDAELASVEYFLHADVPNDGFANVYTATTSGDVLVRYRYESDPLNSSSDKFGTEIETFEFGSINYKLKVRQVLRCEESLWEVRNRLKTLSGPFGVWGKDQLDFFSRFLDNVVDVAPLVVEMVQLPYGVGDKYKGKVSDVFMKLLLQKWRTFALTDDDETIEEWIRENVWSQFVKNDKEYKEAVQQYQERYRAISSDDDEPEF